jgi:hypothetical protein
MKPLFRSLLILLTLASPAFSQAAVQNGSPGGVQAAATAKAAADSIATYLDGVRTSGGRPDYAKPPVSDRFNEVFDLEKLTALPTPTTNDLGWLLDWTSAANRTNILMTLFGIAPGGKFDPAVVRRNQTDYEDQCVAAMNFLIRLEAIDVTTLTRFMAQLPLEQRTPVREAGLQKARQGAGEMVEGAAIWISQGMKPANARIITAALRDTRNVWASYMLPDDRGRSLTMLAALQKMVTDDEVKQNVAALADALNAAK